MGEQPPGYTEGDAYHYILMRILMAARAYDRQAIDGPYLQIRDVDGYRRVGRAQRALWASTASGCCTRDRSTLPTRCTRPAQEDYDHAELILDAYAYSRPRPAGSAAPSMLGDEMIDEASRKMALVVSGKGRAAAMARTVWFDPDADDGRTTAEPAR